MVRVAEGRRRIAEGLLHARAEVRCAAETAFEGDFLHGQVRVGEKPDGFVETDAVDFVPEGAAEDLQGLHLERSFGEAEIFRQFAYADRLGDVFVYFLKRLGENRVFYRRGVGGQTRNDAWIREVDEGMVFLPVHQFVQDPCAHHPSVLAVEGNGR